MIEIKLARTGLVVGLVCVGVLLQVGPARAQVLSPITFQTKDLYGVLKPGAEKQQAIRFFTTAEIFDVPYRKGPWSIKTECGSQFVEWVDGTEVARATGRSDQRWAREDQRTFSRDQIKAIQEFGCKKKGPKSTYARAIAQFVALSDAAEREAVAQVYTAPQQTVDGNALACLRLAVDRLRPALESASVEQAVRKLTSGWVNVRVLRLDASLTEATLPDAARPQIRIPSGKERGGSTLFRLVSFSSGQCALPSDTDVKAAFDDLVRIYDNYQAVSVKLETP